MNTISSHQVLVVGSGPAGLRAAIEASKTCEVALMSREESIESEAKVRGPA